MKGTQMEILLKPGLYKCKILISGFDYSRLNRRASIGGKKLKVKSKVKTKTK